MTKLKKGSWMAPKPETYVECALTRVGIAINTTGYYPHSLLQISAQLARFLLPSISRRTTNKTMLNVRNRQMRRGMYTPAAEVSSSAT